ncbi:MAG: tyrosine-type recombinase/integrase [Hyphomicrobiaceae bacterium]
MNNRRKITVAVVDALKPGATVWDTSVLGFFVRCQAKARVYGLRRRIDGRARWLTIGVHGSPWTPETARLKALEMLGAIAKGDNPAAVRDFERGLPTVADACQIFLRDYVQPKRKTATYTGYEILIRRHICPHIGKLRIDRVTPGDVEHLHAAVALAGSDSQANRAIAVLSKLMTWSERRKWRSPNSNPVRGLERFKESSRERFLTTEELTRLGHGLAKAEEAGESSFAIAAIRLLILTGCRKSEILTLKWDHVDFERGMLLLPDSKTGKKTVVLNASAVATLRAIPRIKGNPHVIAGYRDGSHLIGLYRIWDRIREFASLPDVRIHDLRHSFASVAVAKGGSLPMIGKLLGHTVPATTQRYAHLSADPLRELSDVAGNHIAAALGLPTQRD